MIDPIIRMAGVTKRFGRKVALNNAELELLPGEVLGLVGDNGAGKSTLLKVLAGDILKEAGTVWFRGREVDISHPRQARALNIEMVYQDLSLCGNLTVWENIFLGRYLTRSPRMLVPLLDKRRMARSAGEILARLGIERSSVHDPVRNLSGGQQQAVALARCLLFKPAVILLDEPTASMAVWEQEKILDMIRGLRDAGSSQIMVTHNLEELLRVSDRVTVLKEGRSVWTGPVRGLTPKDLVHLMFVETV